ncbi:anaerobic carbon-monoxide dehydrogenase catalytic subunit [Thermosediminibacter oceani]|uniref:Carbon monoxide dehydrogenase n=1 Tax=Thermosediminibacter oceani (strain ATCC BAA-1034 / DSM 16646 / JW/IW-1228P) TaxID=555079 RepID=D9S2D6_THEOJ|nr:anaerobic carbon-monoxide dehydrogenase catalytic subunit [Thermosediminibacter oceani]ADL07563.1 carbon-monoxide dehydrogenase, catalytic subunit [Thermosediminibacter oceani DSM 16646]
MENCGCITCDAATKELYEKAKNEGIETVWDRARAMQPQCGFGEMGLCCTNCGMGPCRIVKVSKDGPQAGICGATEDTIVARNFARSVAAGAAAHSDHGRDIALALYHVDDKARIKDEEKLFKLADEWGITVEGKDTVQVAKEVAEKALGEFGKVFGNLLFLKRAPEKRIKLWEETGVASEAIDKEIVRVLHSTHMGCDADYRNIIRQAIRAAMTDGWGGSMIGTELSDILFGTPMPKKVEANLGVLKKEYVNIVVHGHEPTLSEAIVVAARDPELVELAKKQGAEGINVAGMCCTGNEIAMRHGIPMAGNFFQQELAIMTGAVEAMIVDVQCIMPSLATITKCYHTKLITTSPKAKIPGATHIEFDEQKSFEIAKRIVKEAVMNFKNRKGEVHIPDEKSEGRIGYSLEAIIKTLDRVTNTHAHPSGTVKPLVDAIKSGVLRGAVAIVGCNNHKQPHDSCHVTLAKELLKRDILVVTTGCGAHACVKAGLMSDDARKYCGKGLATVCELLDIPPVLHMGSCVDISRILVLLSEVAKYIGGDISDLPVAAAAPEWMSEKAQAIGLYAVASGVYVLLGVAPAVTGSENVATYLTKDIESVFGGRFEIESDPVKAAEKIAAHIENKRKRLGI